MFPCHHTRRQCSNRATWHGANLCCLAAFESSFDCPLQLSHRRQLSHVFSGWAGRQLDGCRQGRLCLATLLLEGVVVLWVGLLLEDVHAPGLHCDALRQGSFHFVHCLVPPADRQHSLRVQIKSCQLRFIMGQIMTRFDGMLWSIEDGL